MASQETRQLEIFGQKLILESGGTEVDMPGVAAYMLESTTDDGVKYNQSHHEGGLSRIYAEKQLHVESGVLCNTTDVALIISARKVILQSIQKMVTLELVAVSLLLKQIMN